MNALLPIDAETLPRSLVLDPPMTDAEFEALCRTNSAIQFERTREGVIRMNPPTGLLPAMGMPKSPGNFATGRCPTGRAG